MSSNTTDSFIAELLNNSALYKEKASQENEYWGEQFTNSKNIEIREKDKLAGKELKVARDKLHLRGAIRRSGVTPERGLSLACGSGRAERNAMAAGICTSFHGVDLAEDAVEEARNVAKRDGLDITYSVDDLNSITLEPDSFDLVITQSCLHHVLQLEHLADEIHRTLKPGGVLWIQDYVGETQMQYSDERMEIANAILSLLPEKLHTSRATGTVRRTIKRPTPGKDISPFEAIRSAEIMPIFLERFEIVEKRDSGGIIRLLLPLGAKTDYTENEDTKTIYELLHYLDQMLINEGILAPSGIQCLLRPK
jgi:2-polyprenyl-3-methyl-5-hydroxy-6-metoxy-1,4-benzoquinol methylase